MGAVSIQSPAHQAIVDAHTDADAGVYLTDLFHGQHIADRIHSRTAIGRVYHHAHKAKFCQLKDLFFWKFLVFVPFYHPRQAFVAGEVAGGLLNHQMFFG